MLIYHFVPMIFFYIPLTFLVEPVIIYKSSYVLLVAETSCCSIQLYVLNVCVFFYRDSFLASIYIVWLLLFIWILYFYFLIKNYKHTPICICV